MDDRRRERERRARTEGSPEALAALLDARVKSGELTPEAVHLAALCDDPAAKLLWPHVLSLEFKPWCQEVLDRFGIRFLVWIASFACELTLDRIREDAKKHESRIAILRVQVAFRQGGDTLHGLQVMYRTANFRQDLAPEVARLVEAATSMGEKPEMHIINRLRPQDSPLEVARAARMAVYAIRLVLEMKDEILVESYCKRSLAREALRGRSE